MEKHFKNNLLALVFAALVPLAAMAADGPAGRMDGKGASPEERKARMEVCNANPEKCHAEREARREQLCKDNPVRCKEVQDRRERRMAECKANPDKCRADKKAHFEQRFKQADTDGDGRLSRAEAEQAMPRLGQHFDRIDADKDGHVTLEEMAAARKAFKMARFEQRFKRADTDGDGRISRAEAEQSLPRLARHFDRVDANKDGFVTIEEVVAMRKAFFEHRRGKGSGRGQATAI
jgi:Ca2+-binding EF-hand superfamily protein